MMKFIRPLQTNTKIFAAFAILFCLGALLATWLLTQLGQLNEITVQLTQKGGPAAGAAQAVELARTELSATRSWALGWLAVELGAAVALCLWLASEVARPMHEAVSVARRVAEGDLSTRVRLAGQGENGLLTRAMQEMNEKLTAMIVNVRVGTERIASGSAEIATGSMDLSARTEQQAAALEETASSMEELTATVKQNADHAYQASKLAISASEVAVKGGAVVSEVVGTMASINDSSKRIAEIIGVIDGIAFQTNILALNAAVEAARAGEQGRGFAVVASEVRSLAQRSAAAAREIKVLIDDSVEKVSAGTQLADKAGDTMNEVVSSVKRVTDIIGEIADASAEQTAGIEQVNQAILAMDRVTQQNAALVEESAAAAASMREEAGSLSKIIGSFTLRSEQSKPGAPVQRLAATPATPAKAAPAKAAPATPAAPPRVRATPARPAPAPRTRPAAASAAGSKRAAVAQDADWEEF
jgi:methyl-accepting chemotaxis protein